MKKQIAVFIILLASINGHGQAPSIQWKKCYGGANGDDVAYSIIQTTDRGFIVAGYSSSSDGDVTLPTSHASNEYWIVKIDSLNIIQWSKCLGGFYGDEAHSIIQTADGGYLVAGQSESDNGDITGHHGVTNSVYRNYDAWIVKLNSLGNIQWQKSLGGSDNETAKCLKHTSDGGYIFAGSTRSVDGDVSMNHGTDDYWIVKLNNIGNIQWEKSYGGSQIDVARSICQTNDGGYIAIGYTVSNDGDVTGNHSASTDCWIVKLDSTGNMQWQKAYGGTNGELGYSIEQTSDGGYIALATTSSSNGDLSGITNSGNFNTIYWVIKLDNSGIIQWQKVYDWYAADPYVYVQAPTIKQTAEGGFIFTEIVDCLPGNTDFIVKKINNIGVLEWQKCMGSGWFDAPTAIIQALDGSFVFTGYVAAPDMDIAGTGYHGGTDIFVVKTCNPPTPVINASTSALCGGDSLTLTSTAADSYLWNTGDTTQSIVVNTSGIYTVTNYYHTGCSKTASVNIESLNLGVDTTVCSNIILNLDGGSGFVSYLWSTGATTQTINGIPGNTYWVTTQTLNGCISKDTVTIGNIPAPNINLGNDTTVCANYVFTLYPGNYSTYSWYSSDIGSFTTSSLNGIGGHFGIPNTITCTVTNNVGCADTDTINIYAMQVNATISCNGSSATLDAGPGYLLYQWTSTSGLISTSQTATVTTPDTYTINAMTAGGCEALSEYTISSFSPSSSFTFSTAGLTTSFVCATSGYTYLWDFGDGTTSVLQNPIHTYPSTGSYNVTLNVSNSCGSDVSNQTVSVSNIGINEISSDNPIVIFPTVFTSHTTITFSEVQKNTTIRITDILGKEIKTINFSGKQLIIEKGEMENGIYFVQIMDEKKNTTNKKIIIN